MLEYAPRALVFCDGQLIADRSAAAVLCDPEPVSYTHLDVYKRQLVDFCEDYEHPLGFSFSDGGYVYRCV